MASYYAHLNAPARASEAQKQKVFQFFNDIYDAWCIGKYTVEDNFSFKREEAAITVSLDTAPQAFFRLGDRKSFIEIQAQGPRGNNNFLLFCTRVITAMRAGCEITMQHYVAHRNQHFHGNEGQLVRIQFEGMEWIGHFCRESHTGE